MIVKICGITSTDDARLALDTGADWIGLNLVAGPRRITTDAATRILSRIADPGRAVVLVRLDDGRIPKDVYTALSDLGVKKIQPYGDVTPDATCRLRQDGFEVLLVQRIADKPSLAITKEFLDGCVSAPPSFLLCDSSVPGRLGGTGRRADWQAVALVRSTGLFSTWPPLLLAGGLTPDNVAEAVCTVAPAGVDVSSGVEDQPGRKDEAKLRAFVSAARGELD